MNCKSDTDVTIRFPALDFEIQALSGTLFVDQNKFNYFRAEFSKKVRDYILEFPEQKEYLSNDLAAEVYINGEKRYHMLFLSDGLEIGTDSCWIRLDDPQKILEKYTIEGEFTNMTSRKIYNEIFDRVPNRGYLKELRFNVGDEERRFTTEDNGDSSLVNIITESSFVSRTNVEGVLDGTISISFDNLSYLDALWKLNDKLNLTSRVTHDGHLQVGNPNIGERHHLASEIDSRVWRMTDPRIRNPSPEIKKVIVSGDIVDRPEKMSAEEYSEYLGREGTQGVDGFVPQGVAQIDGVDEGQTIKTSVSGLKRNSLEKVAREKLNEEVRKQNSGSITINPQLSGRAHSDYTKVVIGDLIELTESPQHDCVDTADGEVYIIGGITHNFEYGHWMIDLDLMMYPDDSVSSDMRYFDPLEEAYFKDGRIYG